jgi:hypothetical protein
MAPQQDPARARHEAWEVVLDRLELDVILVERALEGRAGLSRPLDEWHVPDQYGPVPAALRPRAEALVVRQRTAMRALAEQLGVTAAHQTYVAADRAPAAGPVYVDASF